MQPQRGFNSFFMLLERILENAFPGESGAARLQQVGLFTLIFMLQSREEPVTVGRLASMTGQDEANIGRQLKKLIELDLIERTPILNKQGRGSAYHLAVKQNAKAKRLTKAIVKAAASRK